MFRDAVEGASCIARTKQEGVFSRLEGVLAVGLARFKLKPIPLIINLPNY